MALIKLTNTASFDTEEIKKRCLIRAKHSSWQEARNGIIEYVSSDSVIVYFLTGIHSASCYFTIRASEVANEEWEINYTFDMQTIKSITSDDVNCGGGEADRDDIDDMFNQSANETDIDAMFGENTNE